MKSINNIVKALLIIILIVCIISVVYLVVIHNPGEGYTEFYILDHNNNTTDYPTNVSQYSVDKIIIGIKNDENMEKNYTVIIKKNDTVLNSYNKTLKDNEVDETEFYMTQTSIIVDNQELNIELYIDNISAPYRKLTLRYNVIA